MLRSDRTTAESRGGPGRHLAERVLAAIASPRMLPDQPARATPETGRLARARRGVPRPLAGLLAAVTLLGVSWALLNPAWQGPDEDVHFSYVQTLAELHRLPGTRPGPPLSFAQFDAMQSLNNDPIVFFPYAKPEWSRISYEQWKRRAQHEPMDDAGGPTTASGYPPAYYLSLLPGYLLASGDVVTHLYAARLWSVLWLLVTTIAVWLLAGELFGRRRELQLLAAGAVGLWPMLVFVSSSVNPDSMLYAVTSLALWLGTRIVRRGLTVSNGAAFGACVGLALVTKATSLALVPPAAFLLAIAFWRLVRQHRLRQAVLGVALALALVFAFAGSWRAVGAAQDRPAYGQAAGVTAGVHNWREFGSYLWQYYLPRLPFQQPVQFTLPTVSSYPAYNVWVATGWAAFGWVTVFFPFWVYKLFLAVTVLIGVAALAKGVQLVTHNRGSPWLRSVALPIAVFFALATVVLLLGFHWAEYQARHPTLQGRYLFPLAGLAGCAVATVVTLLPRKLWSPAAGAVLGLLIVFQLFSLGLLAARYYA